MFTPKSSRYLASQKLFQAALAQAKRDWFQACGYFGSSNFDLAEAYFIRCLAGPDVSYHKPAKLMLLEVYIEVINQDQSPDKSRPYLEKMKNILMQFPMNEFDLDAFINECQEAPDDKPVSFRRKMEVCDLYNVHAKYCYFVACFERDNLSLRRDMLEESLFYQNQRKLILMNEDPADIDEEMLLQDCYQNIAQTEAEMKNHDQEYEELILSRLRKASGFDEVVELDSDEEEVEEFNAALISADDIQPTSLRVVTGDRDSDIEDYDLLTDFSVTPISRNSLFSSRSNSPSFEDLGDSPRCTK